MISVALGNISDFDGADALSEHIVDTMRSLAGIADRSRRGETLEGIDSETLAGICAIDYSDVLISLARSEAGEISLMLE